MGYGKWHIDRIPITCSAVKVKRMTIDNTTWQGYVVYSCVLPLHETLITVLPTFLTKAMQYISRILSLMLTPSSPHPSQHASVFVFKKIWLC